MRQRFDVPAWLGRKWRSPLRSDGHRFTLCICSPVDFGRGASHRKWPKKGTVVRRAFRFPSHSCSPHEAPTSDKCKKHGCRLGFPFWCPPTSLLGRKERGRWAGLLSTRALASPGTPWMLFPGYLAVSVSRLCTMSGRVRLQCLRPVRAPAFATRSELTLTHWYVQLSWGSTRPLFLISNFSKLPSLELLLQFVHKLLEEPFQMFTKFLLIQKKVRFHDAIVDTFWRRLNFPSRHPLNVMRGAFQQGFD